MTGQEISEVGITDGDTACLPFTSTVILETEMEFHMSRDLNESNKAEVNQIITLQAVIVGQCLSVPKHLLNWR